jgi:hypothetical protein
MREQFAPELDISTSGDVPNCGWYDALAGTDLLVAREIRGGGWAFEAMASEPPSLFLIPPMAATPIAGTDAAYVGCGDGCAALLEVGDDLVQVSSGGFDEQGFLDVVTRWVGAL